MIILVIKFVEKQVTPAYVFIWKPMFGFVINVVDDLNNAETPK